jgi:hypothetical protein
MLAVNLPTGSLNVTARRLALTYAQAKSIVKVRKFLSIAMSWIMQRFQYFQAPSIELIEDRMAKDKVLKVG